MNVSDPNRRNGSRRKKPFRGVASPTIATLMTLLMLAASIQTAPAPSLRWINPAGGNWSNPTNWSTGVVPGTNNSVLISDGNMYTVVLDVNATVNTLTLGGSTGTQILSDSTNNLTVSSAANVNAGGVLLIGGGTFSGASSINSGGVLDWAGGTFAGTLRVAPNGLLDIYSPASKTLSGAITNAGSGSIVWNGGNINVTNSGVFYNQTGALFDIWCDQAISGAGSWYNAGLFRKSAATNTTIGVMFSNSGTIEPLAGILSFGSGDLILLPSSVLEFPIAGQTPGSQFGQIAMSGAIRLDGALSVIPTNSFVPGIGDSFRIMTWNSQDGGFIQENGLDLGNGLYWQALCDPSGLSLVTKSTNSPSPPPGTNLVDQVAAPGGTAAFSISPLGQYPFIYQWKSNGTNLFAQTNSSLILANVQVSNAGTYCVVVTDALNSTNTYCATLTVLTPPSIITQPISQSGTNVTFTVTASGSPPFQFQWRLNGVNIPGATNSFGVTNSSYTITSAQPRDNGSYDVLVANAVGAVDSSIARLKVSSSALPFADNFTNRGSINGFSGVGSGSNTNATRETGDPDPAGKSGDHSVWLQWTAPASGVASLDTRGSSFDTLLGVYTGSTLSNLTVVAANDDSRGGFSTSLVAFNTTAGSNYIIVVDGLANSSGDIVLTWNLNTNSSPIPTIVTQPGDVTASPGGSATFIVLASGNTNLTYQWYFNCCVAIPGATNSSLTVSNAGPLQIGSYRVEVTSAAGSIAISDEGSLELGPLPNAHSFDKLEDLLASVSGGAGFAARGKIIVLDGQSGGFPSVAAGSLGSQIINNFNSTTEQGEPIHANVVGGASRWYLLTATDNSTLILDTMGSDIPTTLAVYTGSDILSLQKVAGDKDSAPDGVHSLVSYPGIPSTSYLIAVDGVHGAQGNINVNWRVGTPPAGGGPGINIILFQGQSLLLQAGAFTGNPAPTYQWQLNGVDIPNATGATYSVPNILYAQRGTYSVVVGNLVGSLTQNVAFVNVQIPLSINPQPPQNGSPMVEIIATATQAVVLQFSTNLNLNTWTPILTNTDLSVPITFFQGLSTSPPAQFYRLIKP